MTKKKKIDLELDDDIQDEKNEQIDPVDEVSETEVIEIDIDDEDSSEEVIEIDEEDLELDIKPEEDKDDKFASKHTLEGKHSLKYDSIFKGRKEDPLTEENADNFSGFNETFEVDKSSHYWFESIDNENYIREKRIKERVYEVLKEHTDLNFANNRRKPSRVDFNHYYSTLKANLHFESFTNIEIFNELAVYFSDNLFNMFKLLDNKWRNMIIKELQDHIGKQPYSHEVMNRNIYVGTEIEFLVEEIDFTEDQIHVTGVVIETDYEISVFKVNSYEKIYEVHINSITKILNNTKFKYNLNKLNNIDFL